MFIDTTDVNTNKDTMIILGFENQLDEFYPFIFRLEEIGVQIKDPINRMEFMHLVYQLRIRCRPTNNHEEEEDEVFLTYLYPDEMKQLMEKLFNLCIRNTEDDF